MCEREREVCLSSQARTEVRRKCFPECFSIYVCECWSSLTCGGRGEVCVHYAGLKGPIAHAKHTWSPWWPVTANLALLSAAVIYLSTLSFSCSLIFSLSLYVFSFLYPFINPTIPFDQAIWVHFTVSIISSYIILQFFRNTISLTLKYQCASVPLRVSYVDGFFACEMNDRLQYSLHSHFIVTDS